MRPMGPRKRASTPSGGESNSLTVDGELINRCEVFDEADLDAALARFEELQPRRHRGWKTAQRAHGSAFFVHRGRRLGRRELKQRPRTFSVDDRRRVVNAGILHGRDANIKDAQATVGVGFAMTIDGRPGNPR